MKTDLLISWLLRAGVMLSALLVVAGMAVTIVHHPAHIIGMRMHSPQEVLRAIREGHGQGIAMLGLLLLIATPVLRVAVSIAIFARERDFAFVAITTTVLLLLLLSFVLGAAAG